jgi:hypothetical protein
MAFVMALATMLAGATAIDSNFAPQLLSGQSAQADITDRIPIPSGIYVNIYGHKYYFGEYAYQGDPGVVFKGGTWEIKVNGRVFAHGYGQTPNWVLKAITQFFGTRLPRR